MAYESSAVTNPVNQPGPSTIDGHSIVRRDDGSIEVQGPSIMGGRIPRSGEFDENLADVMDQGTRRLLASKLVEYADVDKKSRGEWEKREADGLRLLGVEDRAPVKEGEQEDGHDVTHPLIMDATARFQANAITELFPPTGPADSKVLGKSSPKLEASAKRVRTFLNHYLTELDKGYFNDTDSMLMYVPSGGSAFRKASQDYTTGLPRLRYVKGSAFIAPYSGTDLESMPRYAHAFTMTGQDIDRAMRIGMFTSIYLPQPSLNEAKHDKVADTSDARQAVLHEDDRLYNVLEYHIDLEVDDDERGAGDPDMDEQDTGVRPYIVLVDADNEETLLVRRNWREKDPNFKKRIWFAHHKFMPGFGFYGWGYPHVIGRLGDATSGVLNGYLDGTVAANFQGGFFTKEGRMSGELRLEHGVYKAVDCTGEDLTKSFFNPPFKEPSQATPRVLEILTEAGQRFAGNTDAAVGEGNNTGPVGTTVALIEQAGKPQSAVHKRLHVSMTHELNMLCELIEDFMPPRYDYTLGSGQEYLLKSDFGPAVQVLPVSDPNVSSDTQRIMRAQGVLELQAQAPDLYPPKQRAAAHRRMLVALKTPNVDDVGPVVQQPQYLDAVGENALIFKGQSVKVFPTQDDASHIKIHQDGLMRAMALFPPEVLKLVEPHMQAHIMDHMASAYVKQMMGAVHLPPNFDQDGNPAGMDPQIERQVTNRVAQTLAALPHPQPKQGTPSHEQALQQAEIAGKKAESDARIANLQSAASAEESRLQVAFENEERRKDQAMAFQEGRLDTKTATDLIRTQHQHGQKVVHAAEKHVQSIAHAGDKQDQALAQGAEQHEQGLEQGQEQHDQNVVQGQETHEQGLEQGQETHKQGVKQGQESHQQGLDQGEESHAQNLEQKEKDAKQAASIEAEADSHMGGSVK